MEAMAPCPLCGPEAPKWSARVTRGQLGTIVNLSVHGLPAEVSDYEVHAHCTDAAAEGCEVAKAILETPCVDMCYPRQAGVRVYVDNC